MTVLDLFDSRTALMSMCWVDSNDGNYRPINQRDKAGATGNCITEVQCIWEN